MRGDLAQTTGGRLVAYALSRFREDVRRADPLETECAECAADLNRDDGGCAVHLNDAVVALRKENARLRAELATLQRRQEADHG